MTTSNQHPISNILIPAILFVAVFALYATTAAPGTIFGDPSEYQFIPAILGIAHPPGYAFYTLLAKLWQTLVPLGTVAFRTNLLAAAVGAWVVTAVYLIVRDLGERVNAGRVNAINSAIFAALCLAASPDLWQHSIHANAHIVSAALAATHLGLLVRWWCTGRDRYLVTFAMTLGLAATHHPITLMGIPAYVIFVLAVRPRILRQWRALLLLAGCLLLGLAPLLYYPLRSPSTPFGPTDMRTWEGFWGHITAQGLRGNLFHFGLADQPDRALAFWSLLRLQYLLPVVILIVVGLIWLARRTPKPALLIYIFIITNLLFTLNTVQDVMAYLLLPFTSLSIAAGAGALALTGFLARPTHNSRSAIHNSQSFIVRCLLLICYLSLVILPFYQATINLRRGISLHDFVAAEEWVAAVYQQFDGHGEGAVLLSDWEHLTPLWVHAYTQGQRLEEDDVTLVYVSTANPWAESVWAHIEDSPIYLPDYRPAVRDAGFRLVPEGTFYRVVAPPVADIYPTHPLDIWADNRIHIIGYDLLTDTIQTGEPLELVIYQSAPEPLESIWMPYAQLGPIETRWTTDSRLLTHQWQPGEVIAEKYELPIPFTLPPGEYPLRLGYADLSGGRPELPLSTGDTTVELMTITVLPSPSLSLPAWRTKGKDPSQGEMRAETPSMTILDAAVANLDNQIVLLEARTRSGWQAREAPWSEPLVLQAGQPFHLTLTWHALASPRESLTIFIHLIHGTGHPVFIHDYTPLGGACPTYLWFPKWLPGQAITDPYRLVLPADLPPGNYWLEVGMYGMTSLRRLPVVDLAGNLAGDRVILGQVLVE
ncbi:MAG: DUF2723 domain-containing protein [Chloroflexota bacterium]|nr:DUF2723 domain-containing protein [Chloroflexota bacterium]